MEIRKNKERQKALDEAVSKLTEQAGLETVGFQSETDFSMPSTKTLRRIVNLSRSVLFPGYYEEAPANPYNITYHIGVGVEELHKLLVGQIVAGFTFTDEGLSEDEKVDLWDKADAIATDFVAKLPELRAVLSTDVVVSSNVLVSSVVSSTGTLSGITGISSGSELSSTKTVVSSAAASAGATNIFRPNPTIAGSTIS